MILKKAIVKTIIYALCYYSMYIGSGLLLWSWSWIPWMDLAKTIVPTLYMISCIYICWGYSLTVSIIKNYDSTQTGHFLDEQFHVKFVLLMSYRLYIVAYTDSKKLENIERKSIGWVRGKGGCLYSRFHPCPSSSSSFLRLFVNRVEWKTQCNTKVSSVRLGKFRLGYCFYIPLLGLLSWYKI